MKQGVPEKVVRALQDFERAFGPLSVMAGPAAQERYGARTSVGESPLAGALRLSSAAQVQVAVQLSCKHQVPLYPVSTGKNWGYGDARPSRPACFLVDLSEMRRIIRLDEDLGLVTLEPGVTQGQLRAFLDERQLPFLVPTTGAGPACSLLGNALERGYGLTPHADHFAAMMSLKAVLPDGSVYETPLSEAGAEEADRAFKWGTGPYLDGLFSQGAFGIVTEMTLSLARMPESVTAFGFFLERDADLEEAVVGVRSALRALGGMLGGINLMNAHRVLSMSIPYPHGERGPSGVLPPEVVQHWARKVGTAAWMGLGNLQGPEAVVKAAHSVIRKALGRKAKDLVFVTPPSAANRIRLLQKLPGTWAQRKHARYQFFSKVLDILQGRPSELALRLAYWRSPRPPPAGDLNPSRDGCGLLWYSPVVPMRPDRARALTELVHRICPAYGIEPLLTLTSISSHCFDGTVPLLFDGLDPSAQSRAQACYQALVDEGRKEGLMPYRVSSLGMANTVKEGSVFWRTVAQLKSALDPEHLLSPGRYAPALPEDEGGLTPSTKKSML